MSQNFRPLLILILAAAAAAAFFLLRAPDLGPGGGAQAPVDPDGATKALEVSAEGAGSTADPGSGRADEKRTSLAGSNTSEASGYRGRLLFRDGSPAAGARLQLVPVYVEPETIRLNARTLRGMSDLPGVVTDAAGRFAIPAPKVKAASAWLRCSAGAVFEARRPAISLADGPRDLGDLTVLRAARIRGRVLGAGAAVAGVEISLRRGKGMSMPGRAQVTTGAEGEFELVDLGPGSYRIETRSPMFLPGSQAVELVEGQQREGVEIVLQQGLRIAGRVSDDLGRPVAGARVGAARMRESGAMKISSFIPGEETVTDASGSFVLAGLDERSTQIRVSKSGYQELVQPDVQPGGAGLDLKINRQAQVWGRVVDEADAPVVGSKVFLRGRGQILLPDRAAEAVTDAQGRFHLAAANPGTQKIQIKGPSHVARSQRVDLEPGQQLRDLEIVVRRGAGVLATVLDIEGKPVAGVQVVARRAPPRQVHAPGPGGGSRSFRREVRRGPEGTEVFDADSSRSLAEADSDAEGRARLRGLSAGELLLEIVSDKLCLLEPVRVMVREDAETPATLRVGPGGFLDLQVVDAQGKPRPRARVAVKAPEGLSAGSDQSRCDDQGRVSIGPLAPGAYSVALMRDPAMMRVGEGMSFSTPGSRRTLEQTRRQQEVRAGERAELQLRMPVFTKVHGVASDADGPAEGVVVEMLAAGEARIPGMSQHRAVTDAEGRYRIEGLTAGVYQLMYKRKGALVDSEREIELAVDQPESQQDLQLPGAVLRLQLLSQVDQRPIAGAQIQLSRHQPRAPGQPRARPQRMMMISMNVDASGGRRGSTSSVQLSGGPGSATTDDQGRAQLREIPAGKWLLRIRHDAFATMEQVLDIGADQKKDLGTLRAQPGCEIRGKVSFAKPPRMPLALVQIKAVEGEFSDRAVVQNGSYKFTGLEPGAYELRVRPLLGGNTAFGETQRVDAVPGRAQQLDLRVEDK